MKVEMTLSLKDRPGMLLKALNPISGCGGNIVSVHHNRAGKDEVPVEVLFRVRDQQTLDRIICELEGEKISVKAVLIEGRKYYSRGRVSLVFIGHVIDRDIQDTIDRLNKIGLVSDVGVRMADPDAESSVWMDVDVEEDNLRDLSQEVEKIIDDKDFECISEIGVLN